MAAADGAKSPRDRAAIAAFALALGLALAWVGGALSRSDGIGEAAWRPASAPLHEEIGVPAAEADRSAERIRRALRRGEPSGSEDPSPALSAGAEDGVESALSGAARGEPQSDARGVGPAPAELGRLSSYRADRDTSTDAALGYTPAFNPSVAPYKRMSTFDRVGAEYTFEVASRQLREVPVGGDPDPDRDLFSASLVVELEEGEPAPIPSVAPDMRVLAYESDPARSLTFFADSADNFYVAADRGARANVSLLVDADAAYFGGPLPEDLRVRDASADAAEKLAAAPRARPDEAARELGLGPSDRLDAALDTLVYYFRGFEDKPLEDTTGDLYWDLFTGERGVCRHRAFAFVITARALGIPTRYVQNETHAFAEVEIPGKGWRRVDLGGAALDAEIDRTRETAAHEPRGSDPFSSPASYRDAESAVAAARDPAGERDADQRGGEAASGPGVGEPGAAEGDLERAARETEPGSRGAGEPSAAEDDLEQDARGAEAAGRPESAATRIVDAAARIAGDTEDGEVEPRGGVDPPGGGSAAGDAVSRALRAHSQLGRDGGRAAGEADGAAVADSDEADPGPDGAAVADSDEADPFRDEDGPARANAAREQAQAEGLDPDRARAERTGTDPTGTEGTAADETVAGEPEGAAADETAAGGAETMRTDRGRPRAEPEAGRGLEPEAGRGVEIERADPAGLRGETIAIAGVVQTPSRAPPPFVSVYLEPAEGGDPALLGRARADASGRFEIRAPIPSGIEVGDYRILARSSARAPE